MQRVDRLARGRLDRIGDAEQAGRRAVDRDEHHRLSLPAQLLGARAQRPGVDRGDPRGSARLPIATRRPSTTACHPFAR